MTTVSNTPIRPHCWWWALILHQWRSPPPAAAAADMDEKLRRMLGAVWLLHNTLEYREIQKYRGIQKCREIKADSGRSVAT